MLLKNLSIHFFGSIKHATIDFTKFDGKVVVAEGPNGSGKTYALVEAPTWLLFGKTIRKIPAAGIKMDKVRGTTKVSGIIELDDGRELLIERSRPGGLQFSFTNTLEKISGDQNSLEKLLGVDFKLFTTSIVFGGAGVSSFCGLADAERKNVLERILETSRYIHAGMLAKDKAAAARADLDNHNVRLSNFKTQRDSIQRDIEELAAKEEDFEASRKREIANAENEIKVLKALLKSQKAKQRNIQSKQQEIQKKYQSLKTIWQKRLDAAANSEKRAREIVGTALANMRLAEKELEDAQDVVDRAKKDELPEFCPTCGTPRDQWPDPKRKPSSQEGPVNRLEKAHAVFKQARKAYQKSRENLDNCEAGVKKEKAKEPDPPGSGRLEAQKREIAVTRSRIEDGEKNLKKTRKTRKNPYSSLRLKKENSLQSVDQRIKAFKARVIRIDYDTRLLEYWAKNFRNLAAMLLDEAAPFLSKRARFYSDKLMGGRITVAFDPSEQSRGKTFLPVVMNSDGGDSYDKSSKGERARVDLCVLLALRDLMESRLTGKFSQIFLDEVFDGLDSEGVEAVTTTLRRVFKGKSVFLITHDPALKNAADVVLEFSKVKGATIIKGL